MPETMSTTTGSDDSFEIERLRAEIGQESQMKEMLEHSLNELRVTVEELDKRIDTIDDENSEWKTRYETQMEMNQQLSKQSIVLQDKLDEARRALKESKMPKSVRNELASESQEMTQVQLTQLEKDRDSLSRQLNDLDWRLDQESKAYHKANEERKQFVLEINTAKEVLNNMRIKQYTLREPINDTLSTPRAPHGLTNIPQDHRILDTKRGPIRKTAAVKNLPRLE